MACKKGKNFVAYNMIKRRNNMNQIHTTTPDAVVRCEWSGNRANAWDTDGNKRTSEITVGA